MPQIQANKTYAPKPDPGPIEIALALDAQPHVLKAQELAKTKPHSISTFDLDIDVQEIMVEDEMLKMTLVVTDKDNTEIPVSNPFYFRNPPIKVPAGTWRIEDGKDVENKVENPTAAFDQIVVEAVRVALKR